MELREKELFPPIKAWLESAGFTVYTEVPLWGSNVDVVGERDDLQIAIELKMSLSRKVIHQAMRSKACTPCCYCAVPTKPRQDGLDAAKRQGVGVLRVKEGKVELVLAPWSDGWRRRRKFRTGNLAPGEEAGKPNLKGEGPGQEVLRLVNEYREKNPKATWKEMYANVPNHYASYRSMQTSVAKTIERVENKKAAWDAFDKVLSEGFVQCKKKEATHFFDGHRNVCFIAEKRWYHKGWIGVKYLRKENNGG